MLRSDLCDFSDAQIVVKGDITVDKKTYTVNDFEDPNNREANPENATFQITDTKLYVPAVTLSKENDIKLLEKLKSGFKRTIKWNKYQSQMSVQSNNNNLNYLIDPTFTNVNRLFVLSFERIKEDNIKKTTEIVFHIIMYKKYK